MAEDSSSMEVKFLRNHSEYLKKIDASIESVLEPYSEHPLFEPMNYALRGGKRLRPLVCILVNQALGLSEDPYPAATAIELLHTVSLIHDDIVDKAVSRRGVPPYYKTFGVDSAFLVADFVLGLILKVSSSYEDNSIADELAKTTIEMSYGEEEERRLMLRRKEIDYNEYIGIIEKKTASLFRASSSIGAILSKRKELYKAMADFGKSIGMAYQIRDDLSDMDKDNELLSLVKVEQNNKNDFLIEEADRYVASAKDILKELPSNQAVEKLKLLVSDYF
ncbi:MAG: polyprenyl synthetase family protein [Nitrososphaerota archaeon]